MSTAGTAVPSSFDFPVGRAVSPGLVSQIALAARRSPLGRSRLRSGNGSLIPRPTAPSVPGLSRPATTGTGFCVDVGPSRGSSWASLKSTAVRRPSSWVAKWTSSPCSRCSTKLRLRTDTVPPRQGVGPCRAGRPQFRTGRIHRRSNGSRCWYEGGRSRGPAPAPAPVQQGKIGAEQNPAMSGGRQRPRLTALV